MSAVLLVTRHSNDAAVASVALPRVLAPFTLVAPALGFASGAATAAGAAPREAWSPDLLLYPCIGLVMAAVLNAASNALNQIYDLEIDRINKPKRAAAVGTIVAREAWTFTLAAYGVALVLAWLVAPGGRHECFWIVRCRDRHHGSLLGAPVPNQAAGHLGEPDDRDPARRAAEGCGLVGGQDCRRRRAVVHRRGVRAVPARRLDDQGLRGHGRGRARGMPHASDHLRRPPGGMDDLSVVHLPFIMIAVGTRLRILTGTPALLYALSIVMTIYGGYVCYLMLRRPEDLAVEENHVSWAHMYRMMFVAQVGFALAYLLRGQTGVKPGSDRGQTRVRSGLRKWPRSFDWKSERNGLPECRGGSSRRMTP